MAITRTPWQDDDGSGTTGTVINNAEKTLLYDQIDAAIAPLNTMGVWLAEPFNAANFSAAGGMIWGVSLVTNNRYTRSGKTVIWTLWVQGMATSGTASNTLYVKLPGGVTANDGAGFAATAQLFDGVHNPGFAAVTSGNRIRVMKQTESNYTVGSPIYLLLTITFEVV